MTRPTLGLFALLLALGTLSAAGQPPQDKQRDPQSSYEPRSAPGAGQKFLQLFVGDWDVAKTFFPRTGEPARQSGTCRQAMIHDGRFLQSDFVFKTGDGTSTGMGLLGFEASTGKFTSVWTDSRATRMSFRQGKDKFDGKEIVLYSQSLGDGVREARQSRTVSRLEDDGRKIVHRQYAISPDGSERLMMELVLTRKDAKPAAGR